MRYKPHDEGLRTYRHLDDGMMELLGQLLSKQKWGVVTSYLMNQTLVCTACSEYYWQAVRGSEEIWF
jgi:hypothetical protein